MKIVYFGSGAFGLPTIRSLASEHELLAVVTQPDRKAGRGGHLTPTPIGAWAAEHAADAPLLKPERVGEAGVCDAIRAFDADAWVVIAFGQKLSRALLADRFAINLHASLLPRWRGAAPINAAIVAGDRQTGNSAITLADRMDAGLVLGQTRREVGRTQTAGELHDLLADDGPALVADVLARHAAGTLKRGTQDEAAVTLAPKMTKDDGRISFDEDADRVRCLVNGLSPWPAVTVQFRGQPLKILRADAQQAGMERAPGTIIDPALGLVACAPGSALCLLDVQPAGKRPMPWPDFARGRSVQAGDRLEHE
ncbi:MAG: methionyl-tRNA formyltransferase [Phycisphaeraceae bacterium]|nr:MAG: methionyl-tRNA formyltransferase [Phycisphaeraceae bacterium]